jgi:hypothetical protein
VAHVPLDLQHQVPVWYSVLLRIADVRVGEDENLESLTWGPAPKHPASVYGKASYYPADPSTSGGAYSGLNPYVVSYYLSAMTSLGCPIGKTILQPLAGASSSSSSGARPDRDSLEDYPEIGDNACWNLAIEACRINMVGSARGNSHKISSKYPTIGGSATSDARTPNNNIVQNLNPDFNTMRLQTILELIQWMVPPDSPLISLAQQGVEAASNIVVAAPTTGNHQGESSGGNRSNGWVKSARTEASSSASGNRRLADNDAHR